MLHNLGSCEGSLLRHVIKMLYIFGIVHPKMKILYIHKFSSCSKLVFISSAEHKRRCFEIYNVFQNILFFYSTEEKQLEGE